MKQHSDEELMALYQNGDESAFKELYTRHSSKIYAYLKKRLRKEEIVKDTYQEVFMKIHKSKHLYNRSFPVLPWLFTITNSALIDGVRKAKTPPMADEYNFDQLAAAASSNLVGEAQLLTEQLPESQKMAVQMRYVDDSTFEEIAVRLKTTPTNARQIISRGIKRLKQLLDDGGPS